MRKIFISTLFIIFTSMHLSAQERVYLSTDKNCYVAGDRIWCSAFCMDLGQSPMMLSKFSSTVYVELQSEDAVSHTAKIALIGGRGAGALELSPSLPTGNYRLVAYTAQNKNEEGFVPEGKIITIFNTLSGERVEGNVIVSEEDRPGMVFIPQDIVAGNTASISISLPEADQAVSSSVPISIKNLSGENITLSISIFHQDSLGTLSADNISGAVLKMYNTAAGAISDKIIPDYEGEVVRLLTRNINGGTLHVSFPGRSNDYYASDVDSSGAATIYTPNVFGNKDMICEVVSQNIPQNWSVEIEDKFIKKILGNIPKLYLSPSIENKLADRSFSMQVERRFDADTLYELLPVRPNTFLTGKKVIYPLDHYTRFSLMEEVITEFVTEMKIRKIRKQPQISVLNLLETQSFFSDGFSLVMLDGVPVFDHKKIIDYDPLLVKDIEIFTGMYSIGTIYYEGIACFNTYKGNLPSYTFGDNVKILPYKGSLLPLSFTGTKIAEDKHYPDYRQTIYWHPTIDIKNGKSFDFKCVTPLYEGAFDVVVEGLTERGEPIYLRKTFRTK